MAVRRDLYNAVALIVATHGTPGNGITATQIIEKLEGEVSKPTIYRILKMDGFEVSRLPRHPSGYYFDPTKTEETLLEEKAILKNSLKEAIEENRRFKYLPGKFSNVTALGTFTSNDTTVKGEDKPSLKQMIQNLPRFLEIAEDRVSEPNRQVIQDLHNAVIAFQTEGKKIDPKLLEAYGEALVKWRNVGLALMEATEFIMSDPLLGTPEWWTYFTD